MERPTRGTALVTGATNGLGWAIALRLGREGYRVFGAGRSPLRRAALEAAARAENLAVETVEMDVTRDDSVARAVDAVHARAGAVDVLVNNAGIAIAAPVEEFRIEDIRHVFETNFFGALRVTQRVLPAMRAAAGRDRRILNVSSIAGRVALPLFSAYSGSKFALEAMSDALRLELVPFGIHVVLIEPGYIRTNIEGTAKEYSGRYAARAAESPYRAVYEGFLRGWQRRTSQSKATPEDCARVVMRALTESPPRPRYTVTRAAWITARLRWLLSDRAFDRMLARGFGLRPPR
jgi:NAD(P)-dependent dehydrogenase (short-subunit alcohol dehydrogenase family)